MRVGALGRWILLGPAIFLILLGFGQAGMASASIPASADTTARLHADYSPWPLVVVKPLNPAVFEVIQADRAEEEGKEIPLASPILGEFWATPLATSSPMLEASSTAPASSTPLPVHTAAANATASATAIPNPSSTQLPTSVPSPNPSVTPLTPTATASHTRTATPTNGSPPTPTLKASPTAEEGPLPTTAGTFPHTGILDNFDRDNGELGINWSGHPENFVIADNQLQVTTDNPEAYAYWNANPFGANQEVYVTLANINDPATETDLHLKSQDPVSWEAGVLEVYYYHAAKQVYVWTFVMSQGWVRRGAGIPVTFSNGDQFGAVARSDGQVEVYRNGTLIGARAVTAWPYSSSGGYIGVCLEAAAGTLLDDFGGGNLP